jgi:hypothetical protein
VRSLNVYSQVGEVIDVDQRLPDAGYLLSDAGMEVQNWVKEIGTPELHTSCARKGPDRPQVHKSKDE